LDGRSIATDQAAQAARCALAIRARLPNVPIAVATGQGDLRARCPVGDVIDRAFDLLHRSREKSGDATPVIRVDEPTAGLLDARLEVGGDAVGLALFAERELPRRAREVLGRPTSCVGRERELACLDGLFAESVAEGVSRVALVVAPPGIGKTRLWSEWTD